MKIQALSLNLKFSAIFRVEKSDYFTRKGADVYTEANISIAQVLSLLLLLLLMMFMMLLWWLLLLMMMMMLLWLLLLFCC